ncbi:MAG: hypothetical protein ACRC68_16045 [Clostridium sp.]
MKKKIWIYLMLILTSILVIIFLANSYDSTIIDKKHNLIRENHLTHTDILVSYTISIGTKVWTSESLDELIDETDKLLYKAKHYGKNKVCT